MPISAGMYKRSMEGDFLDLHDLTPNLHYRQVSSEYDAETTITEEGYRIPEVDRNPELVFIGDSFTYGVGLSDKDTFIMQYCKQRNIACMNLGVPGYGTINAIERLDNFIHKKNIKPKKVVLVMVAMTSFLGAGNDLYDNIKITEFRKATEVNNETPIKYKETPIRRLSNLILKYSNFARVAKFYLAPMIKNLLVIKPEQDQLDLALKIAKTQFEKLSHLGKKHQFLMDIVLIHPVQDISRGTHLETLKILQDLTPIRITSSANYYIDDPNHYYYKLDGHLNPKGSEKIVELLKTLE